MFKNISLFLLAFALVNVLPAQQKIIDSLKVELQKQPNDSLKTKLYSDLCYYYGNVSMDSAFAYGNKALKLAEINNDFKGKAQALNDIGILHYRLANYQEALEDYRESLGIRKQLKDTLGMAAIFNKIGLCYQNTFQLDSAIVYNTKALKIYESKNNMRYANVLKGNIANIYRGLKQYNKALQIHLEIGETAKATNDIRGLTNAHNNIANAYLSLQDTTNSISYFKKGIQVAKNNNLDRQLAALYNNYGGLQTANNNVAEGIVNIEKSLDIRQTLNDNQGIASSSLSLGLLYLQQGDYKKAKPYLYKGKTLAEKIDANELKANAYSGLSYFHAYERTIDSVGYYQKLYNKVDNAVLSDEISKQIAEVDIKYQTEKKEKEILTQRAELAEKELKINKKNFQLYGLMFLALISIFLGYLLYNQQKLKNKQLKKENELKDALLKIETQNRLQEQRLRISRDLHDNIGAQLTFIISSIDNLKFGFNIEDSKLTNKLSSISEFTKETIYELRDTIWAMNKNEITISDLESRISNFIEKAEVASTQTQFNFNINTEDVKHIKLTSVEGMNIYRIIQEAINNAIKYADASKIIVDISKLENRLQIEILDDGKGYDSTSVVYGNGINNMKKRAADLTGEIVFTSSINKGSSVVLTKQILNC